MTYAFVDSSSKFVRFPDGSTVAWNEETGGPLGGGEAWRLWEADGSPEPEPFVEPASAIDDYRAAIQAHVDATARARNYDSGLTCASYVGSTNPAWAAEAAAFVPWRDAVWVYAFAELDKVQNGQRPQPSIAEIIAELPAIVWPV
jgi:hypothetical protein